MDNQTEKMIIDKVLKELHQRGTIKNSENIIKDTIKSSIHSLETNDDLPVELESKEKIQIENPHNMEALKIMRSATPARIAVGRCGARQKTSTLLNFLADHAAAQDAVFMDVSDDFLEKNNLFKTVTVVVDKAEYLKRPELGKRLSEESKKMILEKCESGKQVQIIIVDGLSSTAIEANVADVLPALIQGLKSEGLSVGTPFFVKYGRVRVEDEIGMLLNCDVVVELVGERPGLVTAESMSSYMIYRPSSNTVEADRTVISNIHKGGTPPTEAGAHMATVVKKILENKASGIKLSQLIK
ncbi:ethanolamine ammonia-lyase subunit EutC [Clostridium bowmanii]|uniref:ethanolamine ammonia-lyase subunit EutC n=1 Tax=Clostridium bowmanii TaxID=132925 RepID=UPI001C0B2401|nr:ethanolamine ammonia-lyase subunit EutC [Clostridium bowmanii]MBU3191152.1 ethanolamine ammonia-lyase subunit EutC [Clostridium bowmanii]MCA1075543.1 ethanolamine ammonia-lyase subunit EutC [Clostridium bowmanii]